MADSIKVLIAELNGEELDYHCEYEIKLENLGDVDDTGLAEGDVLVYNTSTLKWEPSGILTPDVKETIWAEENGNLSNNNRQWSFGNGSTGAANVTALYDCKINEMSIDSEVVGTSIVMDLMINNIAVATASFTGVGVVSLSSEITVLKGDMIGFQTNTVVGTYTDARVAVALIQTVNGIRGKQGDTGAGSNILIQKDDVLVGIVTNVLNFEGNIVSAVDNGSSKTTITINETITSLTESPAGVWTHLNEDGTPKVIDISNFETTTQLNSRDLANRARGNHTGSQTSSTISNFAATVLATVLVGLSLATATPVIAADSILIAIGKLQAQITALVFGDEFQFAESLGESTTTSSTFQQKLRMTTTDLPLGVYIVLWSGDAGGLDNDTCYTQIEENDTTVLSETQSRSNTAGTDWFLPIGNHAIRTLSGVNNFDIDYRETQGQAKIKNVRISLWRIS